MVWILWDAIFLLSGSLFTFGTGPSSSSITEANISFDTQSTEAPNTPSSNSLTNGGDDSFTSNIPAYESSVGSSEAAPTNTTIIDATVSVYTTSTDDPYNSTNSNGSLSSEIPAATTNKRPVQKFVVAAVRSHFNDCPDSHQHFCFHGTCRFLILEDTPACVCHPGFVGLRCEHADLLAVVATNHRQQAVATVLVLCVISCVLIMVLCSFLHCWWRQDCRRRRRAHLYVTEKHGASCYPPESVV